MAYLMTIHILGMLLWIGGLYAALSIMILRAGPERAKGESLEALEKKFLFKASHPGMLLAILSGIGMICFNSGYFLSEGWLYAKLLLAAGLIALTILLTVARRKISSGSVSLKGLQIQRRLLAGGTILILLLVFLKPF